MAVVLDNAWLHEADMFDGLGSQFNARAGDHPNGVNVRDDPPSRSKDQRQRREAREFTDDIQTSRVRIKELETTQLSKKFSLVIEGHSFDDEIIQEEIAAWFKFAGHHIWPLLFLTVESETR